MFTALCIIATITTIAAIVGDSWWAELSGYTWGIVLVCAFVSYVS